MTTSNDSPRSLTSSAPASSTAVSTSSSVTPPLLPLVDHDDALAVEQVGHRAGVGHRAAVAGERGAHVGGGPVPVVGQALHQDRDPAGGVTLVGDRLVLARRRPRAPRRGGWRGRCCRSAPSSSSPSARRRTAWGCPPGRPPPVRAATSTFLISLANSLPRLASTTAFLCLVVAHLEWPLMFVPSPCPRSSRGRADRQSTRDGRRWQAADPAGPRRSYRWRARCRESSTSLADLPPPRAP